MEEKKLCYLNSLELDRETATDVSERKKFFVTFPYPYMNGRLHLGHLFSLSKADFFSYYKELEGHNVLFPFSFHCTGMPISASAKKLQDELDGKEVDVSIKKIILDLGFEDVGAFADPAHWIKTFPDICMKDVRKFHSNVDWRRSFITTDVNKYYDSFVRWQFNRLNEMGFLSFGKRHSIFCPVDNQPCLDHDRRKGENVKPVSVVLIKLRFEEGVLLGRMKAACVPCKVVLGALSEFVGFEYMEKEYFAEKEIFDNISAQVNGMRELRRVNGMFFSRKQLTSFAKNVKVEVVHKQLPCVVKGGIEDKDTLESVNDEIKTIKGMEGKDFILNETENLLEFYEPEEEVISRSGGKCVVALTDQWYINYCDAEWKRRVEKCIRSLKCTDDTRHVLEDALGWINKWGFSRSFGLGTRIPWDSGYLIDSLSDSTIYMAMYTFKHFLYKDLEGKEEIFPSEKLSDDVWNYILLGKDVTQELLPLENILSDCRESFNYFYPVDLRVSGKDLLKNHLIFFLFNHVAVFEEKHWPRGIFTNGHLMLNTEKMSKSSGNFLTADDVITKFGVSSTRMCLAVCGDTNEDANFVEANTNAFVLKLYSYVKAIEELRSTHPHPEDIMKEYTEMSFADKFLIQMISSNVSLALHAHENMVYRDVVKYGFYEMIHAKEMYLILKGTNDHIVFLLYKAMTQLLYPIIPSLARHLILTYFDSDFSLPATLTNETAEIDAVFYMKGVIKKLAMHKRKKKYTSVEILVGVEYVEWKRRCMNLVDQIRCECDVLNISVSPEVRKEDSGFSSKVVDAVRGVLNEFGIPEKKGILFSMDYLNHPEKYTIKFSEYDVLDSLKYYIEDTVGLDVTVCISPKADPGAPLFEFR